MPACGIMPVAIQVQGLLTRMIEEWQAPAHPVNRKHPRAVRRGEASRQSRAMGLATRGYAKDRSMARDP